MHPHHSEPASGASAPRREAETPPLTETSASPAADPVFDRPSWLRETPYWAFSAGLHLVFLLVCLGVLLETDGEQEAAATVVKIRELTPPFDPLKARDTERRWKVLDAKKVKDPILRHTIDDITPDIPSGEPDKKTDFNLESEAFNAQLAVGGGPAGRWGHPMYRGRPRGYLGDPGEAEDAVLAALHWLRRHQHPDGGWRSHGFTDQCKKRCRNEADRYGDGRGFAEHDVGVTALAILAFTGYGHTHRDGKYPEFVEVLRKAVRYLKGVQVHSDDPTTDGRFGRGDHEQWVYDHAIATMAAAELLILSRDALGLKASVRAATRLCLRARNPGFGWRYGVRPGDNDTSVTGWMVLALKTAKNADLGLPDGEFQSAFQGARAWFERATAASGKTGYSVPGDEGSRLAGVHPEPYPYTKEFSCMTAVSVLCRLFAGESRRSAAVRRGVDLLARFPPSWREAKGRSLSTINLYHWYYASYAVFQFGGPEWKRWNEDMKAALVSHQRQGNMDEDGSWDPIGEWGIAGGRVYSTAVGAMTLEVYYRFVRAQEGMGL